MSNHKILVIDDSKSEVALLKSMLSGWKYEVSAAAAGAEGLQMAESEKPNLILLDIVMPEMDGLETLARLKEGEKTSSIPVIMLTSKGEEATVARAFELGATDYIVKPFTPAVLMEKIKKVIR
jgi:DNA-binding response OmpR family regulator